MGGTCDATLSFIVLEWHCANWEWSVKEGVTVKDKTHWTKDGHFVDATERCFQKREISEGSQAGLSRHDARVRNLPPSLYGDL